MVARNGFNHLSSMASFWAKSSSGMLNNLCVPFAVGIVLLMHSADSINCKSHIPSDGAMGYNPFGIEQDFIEVSCSLTYAGNLSPTLKWNLPGPEPPSDKYEVNATKSSVISTLKMSPAQELNDMKIQCRVEIEGTTQQHTIDSGLAWESDTVSVRYAEFRDKEVDVCPGVKWNLVCNPECSYHFERKDDDCQCLYTYNDMRSQQIYQVTSDVVRCGKENENDTSRIALTAIIIVVIIPVLLIAAMLVAFCYLKKMTRSRASREIIRLNSEDKSKRVPTSSVTVSLLLSDNRKNIVNLMENTQKRMTQISALGIPRIPFANAANFSA